MAFGFSPQYKQDIPLGTLRPEQFLVVAIEAMASLGWSVRGAGPLSVVGSTSTSPEGWREAFTVTVAQKAARAKSVSVGKPSAEYDQNKQNIEAFLAAFAHCRAALSEADIAQRLAALAQHRAAQPPVVPQRYAGLKAVFVPREGYFVTPLLIMANTLVFLAMVATGTHIMTPTSQDLLQWGANFRPLTVEGQWWRLATACFLHIGILHLFFNMYALTYIGVMIEGFLGRGRFLGAYLLTGVAASLASLWWHTMTVSAGASGAIFGMYGVFIAMLTSNLVDPAQKKAQLRSIGVFVVFNVLYGLGMNSFIDNAAHLGGLLSGVVVGLVLIPSLKKNHKPAIQYASLAGLAAVLAIAVYVVVNQLPNPYGQYEQAMDRFRQLEVQALAALKQPDGTPADQQLAAIKDQGIANWHQGMALLDSLDRLALPKTVLAYNENLRTYCSLRIASFELRYKGIAEDTDQYYQALEDCEQQIADLIGELSDKE